MHPPWEMTIDRPRSSTFLMYMLLHDVGEDYSHRLSRTDSWPRHSTQTSDRTKQTVGNIMNPVLVGGTYMGDMDPAGGGVNLWATHRPVGASAAGKFFRRRRRRRPPLPPGDLPKLGSQL